MVGVDTIGFLTSVKGIDRDAPLEVQEPTYRLDGEQTKASAILYDGGSFVVEGVKAFINTPEFNLTLMPNFNKYSSSSVICKVQASLPKLLAGNNYEPLAQDNLDKSLDTLVNKIRLSGVDITDPRNSVLYRADFIPCQETLPVTFDRVRPMFGANRISRMATIIDSGGVTYYNKQKACAVYDKGKEQGRVGRFEFSKDIRIEARFKTGEAVRDGLGILYVGDLKERFSTVRERAVKFVDKNIFKKLLKVSTLKSNDINDILCLFSNMRATAPKSERDFYGLIGALAYRGFLTQGEAEIERFFITAEQCGFKRSSLSAVRRRFELYGLYKESVEFDQREHNSKSDLRFHDLISGLRDRMLAVA